jgi:hypothetical protein
MVKERRSGRSGSRNWTRGVFAFFWIVLAGFSGLYLFSVFADPSALGGQLVRFNPLPASTPSSGTDAFGSDVSGSLSTNDGSDPELAEIKSALRQLSQQMAELNTRLKPIEKVVGPVASLPSTPSVATPSTPEPATPSVAPSSPIKKPEAASAPASPLPPPATPAAEQAKATEKPTAPSVKSAEKPPEVKAAEKPAEPPVEAPKPTQQAALEPKPMPPSSPKPAEPPSVATAPMDDVPEEDGTGTDTSAPEPAASEAEPSSSPSGATDSAKPASPTESAKPAGTPESAKPSSSTESASLDPVALPPAANDGSTRYGIEIGVVAKQDGLRPLWREFLTNHSALVAGLQPRRVLAPDKKWRLIAGPFSNAAEAAQACALFKKASRPCEATVYAGDAL